MPQNKNSYTPPITQHFVTITDPRLEHNKEHTLIDIIMIAICGVIAGCDSWVDIEDFGKDRSDWFTTFLELPNGIPSHDTFGRVFALIDPREFQSSFASWMQSVVATTKGQVIAIDGKTNRRTFGGRVNNKDGTTGFSKALHLVSAFATANGVALGQVATDQKSNPSPAVPRPAGRGMKSLPVSSSLDYC
jgi:DDE_Tnp_1-associated